MIEERLAQIHPIGTEFLLADMKRKLRAGFIARIVSGEKRQAGPTV